MSMTKKSYIKIAKAILSHKRSMLSTGDYIDSEYVDFVHDLCVIFEEDNDRFDSDIFKKATRVI